MSRYDISRRTLKNDINEINDFLKTISMEEILITEDGSFKFGGVLDRETVEKNLYQMDMYMYKLSPEERQIYIMLELIANPHYTTMHRFAEELYVSRITIMSDVDAVKQILIPSDAELLLDSGKGIKLSCSYEASLELLISLYKKIAVNIKNDGYFQRLMLDKMKIQYTFSELFSYMQDYMKINNLSEHNCIINRYLAEMRDCDYQKNRLLFRNNIMRIGEYEAFEISKTLNYEKTEVTTPLGVAQVNLPTEKIVIGTIFRAGLPFHEGFLNIFDHSGNAFVSAYREYTNKEHTEVGVHIEYLATPDLTDKVLIIADPMLATGISMEMGMKAFLTKGNPKHIHIACVLAAPEGIEHIKKTFPEDKTTIWCASIDEGLNEHKYIVPGFGDAGDLCYGSKL